MNSKFINALMFTAGAAIGSLVTWKIVKTRYDRIIQEEIDSFKESYTEYMAGGQEQDVCADEDEEEDSQESSQIDWDELEDLDEEETDEDDDMQEYARLIAQYTNNDEKGGARNMANEPKVISPYDFGELDGYSQIELTYYADGTLEDDEYNIVTDGDELLGPNALNTFGDYEEDAVFVRNDRLRTDFQILKDPRTYEEARSIGPGRVDD